MEKAFEKEYVFKYCDVDCNLNGKITSIMDFLCDVGMEQEDALSIGVEKMTQDNLAWVFFDYEISMYSYPKYRDTIKIETYIENIRRVYAYRIYKIYNDAGELIGEANAIAFLIDTENRRITRVPKECYEAHEMDENQNRPLPKKEHLSSINNIDFKKIFEIRYTDIDANNHVNNVKYMEWALNTIPREIIDKNKLVNTKIKFDKEIQYGHNVISLAEVKKYDDRIKIIHRIENEEGEKLTLLETEWR